MTDLSRWSSDGVWVIEECPEQPEEAQPLFQCDHPANAAQVARIHNEMCDQVTALGSLVDEAQSIAAHWSDDRNHWYRVATAAKDQRDAAEKYAREMERQRNAFGEALTRAANGENAAEMAAEAMLALGGTS